MARIGSVHQAHVHTLETASPHWVFRIFKAIFYMFMYVRTEHGAVVSTGWIAGVHARGVSEDPDRSLAT